MKILVLNCGSSSLKYQLLDMSTERVIAKGNFERIGEKESFLTHKMNGEKYVYNEVAMNHEEALNLIMKELQNPDHRAIENLSEINAIGHRVVAGGEIFDKSVIIDEKTLKGIEACSKLAPLHNPAAILGIKACQKAMPGVPMVAAFDTAFHQTMPKENYLYPIPYEYYEKYGIRKYGAHGTSHKYVTQRVEKLMNKDIKALKIVTCHLGQGASLCAVQGGKSVDTSMGLTPLGGITMVTRSGDLDPSVVTAIMKKENLTADEVESILNKKSGLTAVSKLVPDFREIENASNEGNEDAIIAINKFVSIIAQYIARYAAVMEGIDAVVFTGGIGENQFRIRSKICKKLKFMGLDLDEEKNNEFRSEGKISKEDSKVEIWVVPTDEELMIAQDTLDLIK
ncbi:acetate kinase [Clostridium sp. CAG:780]|nr:acetate kinase [Clostridium sp. CAG:780]